MSTPAIAKELGVSNFVIYRILKDYPWKRPQGYFVARGLPWSEKERTYLRLNYSTKPIEEIRSACQNRKWTTIIKQATMLGLKRNKSIINPPKRPVLRIFRLLRREREIRNLSRPDLTTICGYHWNSILAWETGKAIPKIDYLIKWADSLGFDIDLKPRPRSTHIDVTE